MVIGMSVLLRRHGGWSNDKRFVAARRLAQTAGDDPVVAGATVAVTGAALVAALVLPTPAGFVVSATALATLGLSWRTRLGRQPVSFLVERARWEQCRHDLAAIPGLSVDVGRLAKAVDQDGTVYDVLLACSRRDATLLRRTLGMEVATQPSEAGSTEPA
jgi:hypothetical protein